MAAEKRLMVVVDGTLEMAPHWQTILKDYLLQITRYFCGNESASQDSSKRRHLFAVIVYGPHGPRNEYLVQASSWTRNVNKFWHWLSTLTFGGGCHDEAGITEGLSIAVRMFQAIRIENQTQQFGQWHCILVAGSNPYLFRAPGQLPMVQMRASGESTDARTECNLADTETLAQSFIQLFVSLSVISPKKCPQLKAIYCAGNCCHEATEFSVNDTEKANYLVLISDNFAEARAALNLHELESKSTPESILEAQTETSSYLSFPESSEAQSQDYGPSENDPIFQDILDQLGMFDEETPSGNISTATAEHERGEEATENDDTTMLWGPLSEFWPEFPAKDFPTATEKLEPYVGKAEELGAAAFPHCSKDLHSTSESISSVLSPPENFTSQLKTGFEDDTVKITPYGIVLSQQKDNGSLTAVKASFSSNRTPLQVRTSRVNNRGSFSEPQNIGRGYKYRRQSTWSPIANSEATLRSTKNSEFASTVRGNSMISQLTGLQTVSSFKSESLVKNQNGDKMATTGLCGNLNASMFSANRQAAIGTPQSLSMPSKNSGQFTRAQGEYCLKRNHINAFGEPSVSSGGGTSISMVAKSQLITSNLSEPPNGFIKAWEGDVTSTENGHIVFLCRLVAYRKISTSDRIVAHWPRTLHVEQLVSQNHINNVPYDGEVDYLIIEAMNHRGIFDELGEKRLCAYIKLPLQTLLLSVSTNSMRCIGTLYHEEFPLYRHQIYDPQQHL